VTSERMDGTACDQCGSSSTQVRQKRTSNGAPLVAYQCLVCGRATSTWIKRSTLRDPDGLPDWDESLADRYWNTRTALRQQELRNASETRRVQYRAYLRSPKWRSIRARVIERSGGLCEGCRESDATEVHHLTYKHIGDELLFELVALCDGCHERAHDILSEEAA
jgi:hypothetical protein